MTDQLKQTLQEVKDRIGTDKLYLNPVSIKGSISNNTDSLHLHIEKIGINDILIEDLVGNALYLDDLIVKFRPDFPNTGTEPITEANWDKDTKEIVVVFGYGLPQRYRLIHISDELNDAVSDLGLEYEQAETAIMVWFCLMLTR